MDWARNAYFGYDNNYNYNHNHNTNFSPYYNLSTQPPPPPPPYQLHFPQTPQINGNQSYNYSWNNREGERYRQFMQMQQHQQYQYQYQLQPQQPISNNNNYIRSSNNRYPVLDPHTPPTHVNPTQLSSNNFDAQEEFKEKLVSYARYNRNNELMKNIVSEVCMPEINGIVTSTRLAALTRQVDALKSHQKKVTREIVDIQKDFKVKKRKFEDSCEYFQEKYRKLCEPPVTADKFEEMVNKYYNNLKQSLELQRWQKTLAWAHETVAASSTTISSTEKPSKPLLVEILATPSPHQEVLNNHQMGELELELTNSQQRQ